jgi:hypothetical protein
MVKLQAPQNFGGISIAGRVIKVDKKGIADVDVADIPFLREHGFTNLDEIITKKPDTK